MQLLNKITNLGIKEKHSLSEKKRIKLLNRIVLLFTALVSVKLVNELIVMDLIGTLVTVSIAGSFLMTLVFLYYGKIVWAKGYFLMIMTVASMILKMLFGFNVGIEFGLFPMIIVVIIFFDSLKSRVLWLVLYAILYTISAVYLLYYEPIMAANLSPSTFYIMFSFSAGATFLAASFFMNENKQYENQMMELLDQLKTKNEGLETANKELERFAFVASHDLKTPLRNINSFLNLIQRKINKGQTEEIPEYLEFATLNAKRMYNLIEDVLEFSRFSNGTVTFQNEDFNEVVAIAVSNIDEIISSKNAVINCTELPNIYSNKTQMVSLFQNLITNGIKYNESENPTIDIRCEAEETQYKIFIKDNGIGIEKEYQERIFEMFYRLHNQGEYDGSGIGLSTCKKVVTTHGGNITLHSEPNQGTTFLIILPKTTLA